jgi:hypothetical protein
MGCFCNPEIITEAQDFLMLFVCHPAAQFARIHGRIVNNARFARVDTVELFMTGEAWGGVGGQDLSETACILSLCSAIRGGIFRSY